MMYNEFVEGTGCRETDFNYKVYCEIEQIYNDSNLTKEEAYAIGKMRVDNSLTEEEKNRINEYEEQIGRDKDQIAYYTYEYTYYGSWEDVQKQHKANIESIKYYKADIQKCKEYIKTIKSYEK